MMWNKLPLLSVAIGGIGLIFLFVGFVIPDSTVTEVGVALWIAGEALLVGCIIVDMAISLVQRKQQPTTVAL